MRKLLLLALSTILFACESNKPDYILNKTAFCSGLGSEKQEEIICKDSNSNLVSGRIIEYFDDGKIHRNFVVKAGKPNGVWKRYENGLLRLEADYKDGKADGLAKWYSENGKLTTEAHYKDGKENGSYKEYYENGKLKMTREYKNGKRNGYQKDYYENGKLKMTGEFKGDYPHGLTKAYYENGAIQAEGNFKNGKQNGYQKDYYENGKLKIISEFKDGKKNGSHKEYYENGKLRLKAYNEDDYPHGLTTAYYENGTIQAEVNFKNGKEDGYLKSYDKNGFLQQESQWKNGKKISETPKEKIKQETKKQLKSCLERNNVCCYTLYDDVILFTNDKLNRDCFRKKGCRLAFLWNYVSDIASKGVFVDNNDIFIYTNKQYVNGQRIDPEHYYEYVGPYEYRTITGGTNRVDAFKETNIPWCGE